MSVAQIESAIRSEITAKTLQVIGYPILNGVRTVEVSSTSSSVTGGTRVTVSTKEWVDRLTYLPLQCVINSGSGTVTGTFTNLLPTANNLKQVYPSVASGFKRMH